MVKDNPKSKVQPAVIERFLIVDKESEEMSLSALITAVWDTELPIPMFDGRPEDADKKLVGHIIYLELKEEKDVTHVVTGGFTKGLMKKNNTHGDV